MLSVPTTGDTYAVTDKTRAIRLKDRATYDRATVHAILDEALIAHVGFVKDGYPLVLPMGVRPHICKSKNRRISLSGTS
jgi:hypothetical protein